MSEFPDSVEAILEGARDLEERLAAAMTWLDKILRNDPRLAQELIDTLAPEVDAAGNRAGAAWLKFFLGWLRIDADDFEQGASIMEAARAAFEDLGDREGIARCLNALGVTNMSQGVYDLALDLFRESARMAEKEGRLGLAGAAAMNLAQCLYELEEPEEALQTIEHCRKEFAISPYNISAAHSAAGLIYRSLGRPEEAERELEEAIRTAGEALHDGLEARQVLAEVYIDLGRPGEAEALTEAGLEACSKAGERMVGSRFRLTRARLSIARRRIAEAVADIESAILTAREIGSRKIEMDAEKVLSLAWQTCGESRKALEAFARHARLKEAMKKEQTSRRILGLHGERARREARHYETLYRQISVVSEIGRRITANLDLEATLETLYGAVNGLMDAPTLLIALVDEARRSLDYRLVMIRGERREPISTPLDRETFGCWCVRHQQDILIGDLESEYRQYVSTYGDLVFDGTPEKSLVFVPLLIEGRAAGMISVQSHLPNAYDKRKVETLRAIGAYISIAIQNSSLFGQIQRIATLDDLTGLLNRRRLTEVIEEEYLKVQRYGHTTGVIMADVDRFKRINDTHGHQAGDLALRAIAGAFGTQVRGCDSTGRFGGEEFVLILPQTDLDGTRAMAERLRRAIEALEVPLPRDKHFKVTASFGVALLQPGDPSHEAVLQRADQALYRAKQSGRNRVAIAEPAGPLQP